MRVLDAMLGATSPMSRLGAESIWPGGALAGARSAASAVMRGGGGSTAAWVAEAIPKGAVRIGGAIITASAALQEVHRSQERAQVEAAITRFHLDRTNAAHILSARAYVWGHHFAPLWFWEVPFSGPVNERVAQAIGRFERDNPGTLGAATKGDPGARRAIEMLVRGSVGGRGVLAPIAIEHRTSAVDPALSATSTTARAILGIQNNQSWVAHHLITFSGVASLSVASQQAIAASGWRMDSLENLMALPANFAAYLAPPNLQTRPFHAGGHPHYNMRVSAALVGMANGHMAGETLRAWLRLQEAMLRADIYSVASKGQLR
jgi:hypothetical protein